ncbi:glycolate oxidase iron-sulfur subunit [uncultured bacterium]|nr:glycolate oxidase iron-sulfur subunit [uncultured bacterium]
MKKLLELRSEIDKCVRCGTCRSTCPTFKVIGRETSCARGRVTLVAEYMNGGVGLSETFLKHLKECTLCGACRSKCPNGVDTVAIFAAARRDVTEKQGVPFAASIIFKNLLASGGIMSLGLKLATRLQGLFFRDASAGVGLLSRFSLPLVGSGRLVPPLAPTSFLDLPEVKSAEGKADKKDGPSVAFYAGCGINYLMPEVGLKSLEAVRRAGASVSVPQGQACCGMPAYAMGDIATARSMALKNLEVFEAADADFIVTSCATCGHGLKSLMASLLADSPELKARAEKIAAKTRDISELLIKELGFKAKGRVAERRVVTYHDPCHLGRAQGLREEPRELLKMGPGVVLKEMKNPCLCCGLGGGLMYNNYELSMEIAAKKAENIKKSGAEFVATACPGCIVQLRDGLHRSGVDVKVCHVVELLSEEKP